MMNQNDERSTMIAIRENPPKCAGCDVAFSIWRGAPCLERDRHPPIHKVAGGQSKATSQGYDTGTQGTKEEDKKKGSGNEKKGGRERSRNSCK